MNLKLISFNIWFEQPRDIKGKLIIDFLQNENADIICLQEVAWHVNKDTSKHNQFHYLMKELGYYQGYVSYPMHNFDNQGRLSTLAGQATFIKSTTRVISFEEGLCELYSGSTRDLDYRVFLVNCIEHNKEKVRVINIHLSQIFSLRHLNRQNIIKYIEKIPQNDTIIICGDFNAYEKDFNNEVRTKAANSGFRDAWKELYQTPCITYYGSEYWFLHGVQHAYSFNAGTLDFVFIRGNIKPTTMKTVDLCPNGSDHLALISEFTT